MKTRVIDSLFGEAEAIVAVKKKFSGVKTDFYMLPEWLAGYIAGMIDGDGYIGVGVNIYNNELGMLLILQQFIGGRISKARNKDYYTLSLRQVEQGLLLPQIIPYLIIKKERAIKLLQKIGNK